MKNSEESKDYSEPHFDRLYFPNGIFHNVCELDMIRFSYNLLKTRNKDPDLAKIIEIIEKLPQDDYRVKKLRVNLYLSLQYAYSGFFNIKLYEDVANTMQKSMKLLQDIVEKNGKEILAIGYDSVSFIVEKKEGQELCDKANKQLETKVKLKFFPKVVKVMNLSNYHTEAGEILLKRLTRTPEAYEEVKLKMLECLEKEDFEKAYSVVVNCTLNQKAKKRYVAVLNEIVNHPKMNSGLKP
jgi:hypothetical protein